MPKLLLPLYHHHRSRQPCEASTATAFTRLNNRELIDCTQQGLLLNVAWVVLGTVWSRLSNG